MPVDAESRSHGNRPDDPLLGPQYGSQPYDPGNDKDALHVCDDGRTDTNTERPSKKFVMIIENPPI